MREIKNSIFVLLFFVMSIVSFTACNNEARKDLRNDSYKFEEDASLSKFINTDIRKDVLESHIGAVPPELCFANDNYAGILNYNGILIYSIKDKKLSSAIDIKGLGFDQIQGDEALVVSSNNEYVILSKAEKKDGYVYSFEKKALSKIDDISKIKSLSADYTASDEISKVKPKIDEKDREVEAIKTADGYVIFVADYNNLKDSDLIYVDKNYDTVSKFKISE